MDVEIPLTLVEGYYENVFELIKMMTNAMGNISQHREYSYFENIKMDYNKTTYPHKFTVSVETPKLERMEISPDLSKLLGFSEPFIFTKEEDPIGTLKEYHGFSFHNADKPPLVFSSCFDTMYIYCNLVEDQLVGNVMAPLLRIIDIRGYHYGDIVCKTYETPHYVPVLLKHGSIIEINIKNDMNEFYKFKAGKVIVKLHLRKHLLY